MAPESQAQRRIRQLERQGRIDKGASATFFAGAERRGSATGRAGALTVSLVAREVTVEIRADALVDIARVVLLQLLREGIMTGQRPDTGGPQKPLPERKASEVGRKSQFRGFRTGVLADGLRSPKMTGTTAKARARILPPTNRNVYIATEAKRGVFFLLIGQRHEQALQQVVDAFVDDAIAKAAGLKKTGLQPMTQRTSGGEE